MESHYGIEATMAVIKRTIARVSITVQTESSGAGALKRTNGVYTDLSTVVQSQQTLIHIYASQCMVIIKGRISLLLTTAILSIAVECKSLVTSTHERRWSVNARLLTASIVCGTFISVCVCTREVVWLIVL